MKRLFYWCKEQIKTEVCLEAEGDSAETDRMEGWREGEEARSAESQTEARL